MKIEDDIERGDAGQPAGMELAAIPDVSVKSFTATPEAVEEGGASTIAWRVTLPENDLGTELRLNGQIVGMIGQKVFTNLTQSTDFLLSAATETEEKLLRRLRVRVDAPDCQWAMPIDPFLIIQQLKVKFDNRFSGSSHFSLRGTGTEVTLDVDTINIAVPMTILVEDWFNADMDVAIKLSVQGGGGHAVLVLSRGVSLSVSWTFFEHLASLGCTTFVESGMSQLGEVLMANIVDLELAPDVEDAFNDEVNKVLADRQKLDPQQREYELTFFELSADGARFKVCPKQGP
jgi:hypothetical protein